MFWTIRKGTFCFLYYLVSCVKSHPIPPLQIKISAFLEQKICFIIWYVAAGSFRDSTKLNAWLLGKDGYCALPLSCLSHLKFGIRNWKSLKFDSTWVKNIFCVPWWVNYSLNSWIAKQILYKKVIHMFLRTNFKGMQWNL